MTYKDIMNITPEEWKKFDVKEMKSAVRVLQNAVNKRLGALKEAKLKPEPLRTLKKSGGGISIDTRGLDDQKALSKLRKEFTRAQIFLSAETSTIKGYERVKQAVLKGIGGKTDISNRQYERMWRIYERLKEENPEVESRQYRYDILKTIQEEMIGKSRKSISYIVDLLNSKIENDEIYQTEMKKRRGVDVSSFYETDGDI